MTPEMAAGVDVPPSNGERGLPEDRHRYFLSQRLRQVEGRLAKDAQLKKVDVRTDRAVVILTGAVPSKLHEVKGAVKAKVGKLTNNPEIEADGKAEKVAGGVQRKIGQVKKVLGQ